MSVPDDIRLLAGEKESSLPSTRPRPLDLPSPVVAGMGISARSGDIDIHNVKGTKLLLPGIIRRRLLRPFTLIVMGAAFLLLGWWNYWYGLSDRIPVQTERVAQVFAPNPQRYIAQRYFTTLPATLPHYRFSSLGSWVNGTMEVVAGDADATDIKIEVLVEVPTNQVLDSLKYEDKDAQTTGEITLRVAGKVFPPIRAKWIKVHAQMILPRDNMYQRMDFTFKSQAPYWFRTKVDALDTEHKITFKDFNIDTTHGDIDIASLSASDMDIHTGFGDIRHGLLNVSPERMYVGTKGGTITES